MAQQTAKEKAEELVYRYIDEKLIKDSYFCKDLNSEIYSSEIELKNAKHCALILVEELVDSTERTNENLMFWLEVISEIIKL